MGYNGLTVVYVQTETYTKLAVTLEMINLSLVWL